MRPNDHQVAASGSSAEHQVGASGSSVAMGATSIGFLSRGNATLQLATAPEMRGRVMALWAVAFLGSTPIGGPLTGWLSEAIDPRAGLVLAGAAGLVAAVGARSAFARLGEIPKTGTSQSSSPITVRRHFRALQACLARAMPDERHSPSPSLPAAVRRTCPRRRTSSRAKRSA